MSLVHWPEGELSEDISEQIDVNEVSEGSEKHPNDGKNADESATGQAEPPCKRKKAESAWGKETILLLRTNFFLASRRKQIRRKLQAQR